MESPAPPTRRRGLRTVRAVGICIVVCLLLATRVHLDTDVLAVMPPASPDVQAFREIQERFGGMDVVQVGVEAADALAPDFLAALQDTSDALAALPGVKHVLSLTTVQDFVPDQEHGGIVTDRLVAEVPHSDQEVQALRAKVMGKTQIVGNLIAYDGKAVQLYCFLHHTGDVNGTALAIVKTAQEHFAGHTLAFGGAPFIAASVGKTLTDDLTHLAPWSALILVAALLWRLRRPWVTAMVLGSTLLGVVIWLGILGMFAAALTPTLALVPLVLFVVGSVFQLQVAMTWQPGMDFWALRRACRSTWGAALLMTVLLLSLGMLQEVRAFALLTALGLLVQSAVAYFALPAMLACLRDNQLAPTNVQSSMPALRFAPFLFVGLVLVNASQIKDIRHRLDLPTLLGADSEPVRSMGLFREHFGTAQFLFLQADGDFNDPLILRELEWLADSIALLPGVTAVTHVGGPLAEANAALEGLQRMPDTRGKAQLLYSFVGSEPAVTQLISHDADHALLTIKVSVTGVPLDTLIETIAQRVAQASGPRFIAPSPGDGAALHRLRQRIATRIVAAARATRVALPQNAENDLMEALAALPSHPDNGALVAEGVQHFMASDECPVTLPPELKTAAVLTDAGNAVAALGQGASDTAVANALDRVLGHAMTGEDIDDLALSIQGPLDELWQQAVAQMRARLLLERTHLPQEPTAWHEAVISSMMDLRSATVLVPGTAAPRNPPAPQAAFSVHLTGEPLLHKALAADVHNSLQHCLLLGAVVLLTGLGLWYRNPAAVLVVAICTVCTGLMTAGAMGVRELALDTTTLPLFITTTGMSLAYAMFVLAGQGGPTLAAKNHSVVTHALFIYGSFTPFSFARTPALCNMGHLVTVGAVASLLAAWTLLPALVAPLLRRLACEA